MNGPQVSHTPYDKIEADARWSTFAADRARGAIDPQGRVRFTIGSGETIASAGSCFAARLAERLRSESIPYFVAEEKPRWMSSEQAVSFGYEPFSARYGLIYSCGQLQQLFDRAFGTFEPVEDHWRRGDRFVDPFRPRTSPEGYATLEELIADRAQHLAAVRAMFERTDVFLFTLGLTETWRDRRDGAIYPYCPGLIAGEFDESIHEFHNTGVRENVDALEGFLGALRAVNSNVRVILSVSPVPLGSTMQSQHVARASTYSKSVLRVAAQEIIDAHHFVDYFAAYEMISQTFVGNAPFVGDGRHLDPNAVRSVVKLFFTHYLTDRPGAETPVAQSLVRTEPLPCDEDVFAR